MTATKLNKLKARMVRLEIRLRAAMARYRAAERAYVVAYLKSEGVLKKDASEKTKKGKRK